MLKHHSFFPTFGGNHDTHKDPPQPHSPTPKPTFWPHRVGRPLHNDVCFLVLVPNGSGDPSICHYLRSRKRGNSVSPSPPCAQVPLISRGAFAGFRPERNCCQLDVRLGSSHSIHRGLPGRRLRPCAFECLRGTASFPRVTSLREVLRKKVTKFIEHKGLWLSRLLFRLGRPLGTAKT